MLTQPVMSLPESSSPSPRVHATSLVLRLVELRESAELLICAHGLHQPAETLSQTRSLIDTALDAIGQVHDANATLLPADSSLAQAETYARRELTAARRHQELGGRSDSTCRAACELALRALTRALDKLISELMPHTLAPRP